MANWRHILKVQDAPIAINYLKHLLGEEYNSLPSDHELLPLFKAYESWESDGRKREIPDSVIQLATYGEALRYYRGDYHQRKDKNKVVNRLASKDEVRGLLFEFRSAIHFDGLHKSVQYSPNVGSQSEADLRVSRHDGKTFYVECTARKPKRIRLKKIEIVANDAKNALRNKAKQTRDLNFPRIVAVFIPEEVDLTEPKLREELDRDLKNRFENDKDLYSMVSALVLVAHTSPTVKQQGDGVIYYDTDLNSLTYPNTNATYPLPPSSINPDGL